MKKRVLMLVIAGMLLLGGCETQDSVVSSVSTKECELATGTEDIATQEVERDSISPESENKSETERVGLGYIDEETGRYVFNKEQATELCFWPDDYSEIYQFSMRVPAGLTQWMTKAHVQGSASDVSNGGLSVFAAVTSDEYNDIEGLDDVFDEKFFKLVEHMNYFDQYGTGRKLDVISIELQQIHDYQVCKHVGNFYYINEDDVTMSKPYVVYSLESKEVPGRYLSIMAVDGGNRKDIAADVEWMISTIKEEFYED